MLIRKLKTCASENINLDNTNIARIVAQQIANQGSGSELVNVIKMYNDVTAEISNDNTSKNKTNNSAAG